MDNLERQIKFHLTKQGWYIDDVPIEVSRHIQGEDIYIDSLNSNSLAYYDSGKIFISKALACYGTLPQIRIAILHEMAHKKLDLAYLSTKDREYECDRWALSHMINSGKYTINELLSAIGLFREFIRDGESETHPASSKRYSRLYNQLREYL